jgi:glycine oxidase
VLNDDSVISKGTLVFAQSRDRKELEKFARRTQGYELVSQDTIALLEPDLANQFQRALYFKDEAHLDPRLALIRLAQVVQDRGVGIHFNQELTPEDLLPEIVVDCRGYHAAKDVAALRPVKGEMLIVKTAEVNLSRPVRLLHPRIPLYIVPRDEQHFMIGATMIENGQNKQFSVRSMLELLGSAYALHPSFAEAQIVEMGVDLRPAYIDNLPRVEKEGAVWRINGLYRHGYLLAPYMAKLAAEAIIQNKHDIEKLADFNVNKVTA